MTNKPQLIALAFLGALLTASATEVGRSSLDIRAYRNQSTDETAPRYKRQVAEPLVEGGFEARGLTKRGNATTVKGHINWNRHHRMSFLRFVLAASVKHPYSDSVPMTIGIKNVRE